MSNLKVSTVSLNSSENTKISIATNNMDIVLTANNTERLRVDSEGSVRITGAILVNGSPISGTDDFARTQANTSRTHANAAFAQANLALSRANTSNITADVAFSQANLALSRANTANITADLAFAQANAAFAQANTGGGGGGGSGSNLFLLSNFV